MVKIVRENKKFYLQVFYPTDEKKFLGKILTFSDVKEKIDVFCTHIKKPHVHFFIKEQGYPINNELLKQLKTAGIKYVMIPEKGKNGFNCYLAKMKDYFSKAAVINEDKAEAQRVIPLRELHPLDRIPEHKLKQELWN